MTLLFWLANLLAAISGLLLVLLTARARPTRGEYLVGLHRVTAPLALAQTLAVAVALLENGLQPPWLGWLLGCLLPLHWLALTALPFGCFQGPRVRWVKLLVIGAVIATLLVVDGAWLRPGTELVGVAMVAAYAVGAAAIIGGSWLLPRLRRLSGRRASATGDDFESRQGAWQREQWQLLPAHATAGQLLEFVRAFDAEVKAQCLQRLAALPDLVQQLADVMRTSEDSNAPHYVMHHYPRRRSELAAGLEQHLDFMLSRARTRLRADRDERPFLGNFTASLAAGIVVLRDGGDVRAALQRWHDWLDSLPSQRDTARQLAQQLRRS